MDLTSMMAEDSAAKATAIPTDEKLAGVAELAAEQLRLEKLVIEQEATLAETRSQLTKVSEVDLPARLEELGLSSITLANGEVVLIDEEIYAGITKENQPKAFEWLEATGNDGIIKNEVKSLFGKGQDAEAKQLMALIETNGFSFTNNKSVHPQTLRAFVKGQLRDGYQVPFDLFSVHVKRTSSIKIPRQR